MHFSFILQRSVISQAFLTEVIFFIYIHLKYAALYSGTKSHFTLVLSQRQQFQSEGLRLSSTMELLHFTSGVYNDQIRPYQLHNLEFAHNEITSKAGKK